MNPSWTFISNTEKKLNLLTIMLAGALSQESELFWVETFTFNSAVTVSMQTSTLCSSERAAVEKVLRSNICGKFLLPRAIRLTLQIKQQKKSFCWIYRERRKTCLHLSPELETMIGLQQRIYS